MFTCYGCQDRIRDKDLGVVVEYTLDSGRNTLLFCWPPERGCWLPTTHYMLHSMTSEERESGRNVRLIVTGMFMETEKEFEFDSLEGLFAVSEDATQGGQLDKVNFRKPLSHYQDIGRQLVQKNRSK